MIYEITSLSDPRLAVFASLTEAQLRNRLDPTRGIFIAESPKVIRVAMQAGYEPQALLCERKHITGDAADIIAKCGDIPIYTGERELLAQLTGYTLTRGVLCAMHRRPEPSVAEVVGQARRIVVIDGVVDTTNIGAIFRSAAALGIDAVLLTRNACDPLNRRAVRVSMGSVFLVPWTWLDDYKTLHDLGFKTAAMAEPCAIVAHQILERTNITPGDYVVVMDVIRIPMSHQVDSLNVAAAASVAFWELARK